MRVGLALLNRAGEVAYPWIAIIDYSLAIGRNKVLVVLRVPLTKLREKGKALTLEDCECVGLGVCIATGKFWSVRKIKVLKALYIQDFNFRSKTLQRSLTLKNEHSLISVPL